MKHYVTCPDHEGEAHDPPYTTCDACLTAAEDDYMEYKYQSAKEEGRL